VAASTPSQPAAHSVAAAPSWSWGTWFQTSHPPGPRQEKILLQTVRQASPLPPCGTEPVLSARTSPPPPLPEKAMLLPLPPPLLLFAPPLPSPVPLPNKLLRPPPLPLSDASSPQPTSANPAARVRARVRAVVVWMRAMSSLRV
jgi:hypothetical protein